jgi:hypothetical protein
MYYVQNSSGSATVSANEATAPYGYSGIQTSSNIVTATNLAIGTYTATITDVNGCTTTTRHNYGTKRYSNFNSLKPM